MSHKSDMGRKLKNKLQVLTVLDLLAVTRGLLEGLDNEGGSAGNDGDGGVTVLDGQADSDPQTLHLLGGLGDIITDLLGGLERGEIVGNCEYGNNTII